LLESSFAIFCKAAISLVALLIAVRAAAFAYASNAGVAVTPAGNLIFIFIVRFAII
jgi:hypothetical protein